MNDRVQPPFRADHVGSFLRPAYLLQAREQHFVHRTLSAQGLREVEDRAIAEIVQFQRDVGLRSITDGEFRRTYFHVDFLEQLEGVAMKGGIPVRFRSATGKNIDMAPPLLVVNGKVRHVRPIQLDDFNFLKSVVTRGTPKVAIPSPTMLHFRGGRAGISQEAYPDLEQFSFLLGASLVTYWPAL